jgi:hypothetical protein
MEGQKVRENIAPSSATALAPECGVTTTLAGDDEVSDIPLEGRELLIGTDAMPSAPYWLRFRFETSPSLSGYLALGSVRARISR